MSLLIFNNVSAQKIPKEEKKQRKADFKLLIENISDTEISYENSKKLDKIEFINRSSEHKDDITLINENDLHRFIPFQNIFNDGKKVFMFKRGIGRTYPNEKNLNEYIQSEEIINIYNFVKSDESSCMLFEYKNDLNNKDFQYAVIKKSVYENRMNLLKKMISLSKQIGQQEFKVSYNKVFGLGGSYDDECEESIYKRLDFFVISSDPNENTVKEEAKKTGEEWVKKDGGWSLKTSYFEKDIKAKASNIYFDYNNLNFEIDSIKYYKLDVISLLNSGILKDSIKSYWLKPVGEGRKNYNDLKGLIKNKNYEDKTALDNYNADEVYLMSNSDYWAQIIPKDNELMKFLTISYINLPISINLEKYIEKNKNNNSALNITKIKIDNSRGDVQPKDLFNYRSNINYFYCSTDLVMLRNDVINLLSSVFCEKSRAMNSDKNKKEKEEKYKNDLAEKYGLKYVEAALEGDIIIGMPEDLLTIPLRAWNIDSSSQWENGYLIYCKFKFDTSKRIKIIVRNGKVAEVSKW